MLAPYAVTESNSRGRQYAIADARDRNAFQRDYTRISHSQAFRRLQGKTQVFSNTQAFNEKLGDLYRTRLTHSLEVEQLSRSVARQLNLNEDLAAVLAIGHDIGHAPFGHLGQDILNELMKNQGGFEHNYQALRLVDKIENPYREYPGLNLMFETREGLLKHCTPHRAKNLGDVAYLHVSNTSPTLEAQVVDWCDAIAYLHADLEDAFTLNLLSPSSLLKAPGYSAAFDRVKDRLGSFDYPEDAVMVGDDSWAIARARSTVKTIIREMFSTATSALIEGSRHQINKFNPQSLADVRSSPLMIAFTPEHAVLHQELKDFSRKTIYSHPVVSKIRMGQAEKLEKIFKVYESDPSQMRGLGPNPQDNIHRAIADHISGMTDRCAEREYDRLFDLGLIPSNLEVPTAPKIPERVKKPNL